MVRHTDREVAAIKKEVYTHRSLDTRHTWGSTRIGAGVAKGVAWLEPLLAFSPEGMGRVR